MATKEFKGKSNELNDWMIHPSGVYLPVGGKAAITDSIEPGIWRVTQLREGMTIRMGIKRVDDKFNINLKKIYKTGGEEICDLIEKTWEKGKFKNKKRNLSTFFVGPKGTGKTMAVQIFCNKFAKKYPILLVENHYDGMTVDFLQEIDFECIILVDEAEKVFAERKTDLLKICDGVHCQSSKIVLMTANSLDVDNNLISRPGRVRYVHRFDTLSEETCREFLLDNLENKESMEEVYNLVNKLNFSTIDMLTNIVEEYNLHSSIPLIKKYLNIEISNSFIYYAECYNVKTIDELNEVTEYIKKFKPVNRNLYDFIDKKQEDFAREADKLKSETDSDDVFRDKLSKLYDKYPLIKYDVRGYYSETKDDLTIGTYLRNSGKIVTNPNEDGVFIIDLEGGKGGVSLNNLEIPKLSVQSNYARRSPRLVNTTAGYSDKIASTKAPEFDVDFGEDECYNEECCDECGDKKLESNDNNYRFCIFSHKVDGRKLYGNWNKRSLLEFFQ